jgi:hypothetical protein
MGNESVPQVEREIRVSAAEASNEVVLEGADGPFGCIATVQMRGSKLKVDMFGSHEGLEGCRGFVVQALELRSEAAFGEKRVCTFVRRKDLGTGFALHQLDVNGIAVVIVEDEHVGVSSAGRSEKTAWLVSVDLSSDALMGGKDVVRASNRWAVVS